MGKNYKEKFYSKYVSAHNARLYARATTSAAENQFPAFENFYGRFLPTVLTADILDLGCGDGGLVHWLKKYGYVNAAGVDISEEQVQIAKSFGLEKVYCQDLVEFLKRSKTKYECIFLRDVLGHFTKPEIVEIMELVYENLARGGRAIIKTPNAESPLSGQLRYGDFTHDVSFTRTSLQQLAEIVGFKKTEGYPTLPVIHGFKSVVRFLLWQPIELILRFYRLVDSGSPKGIFTQNVIVVAYK